MFYKNNRFALVSLSAMTLFLILFCNVAYADSAQNPCSASIDDFTSRSTVKPEKYYVEITLTHVGDIDLQSGEYPMTFWVDIRPAFPNADFTKNPPPTMEFVNGRNVQQLDFNCSPNLYEYKVQGTFFGQMNLRSFPFEVLNLKINLESISPGNMTYVQLLPWKDSAIDENLIVPGYQVSGFNSVSSVHMYNDDENYSSLITTVNLSTYTVQSLLKSILPMVLLPGLAILSFWIEPSSRGDRLGLSVGTLLSAVIFNFFMAGQIPPVSYLTIFDKVVLVVYAVFLYTILCTIYQGILMKNQVEHDKIVIINHKMRYGIIAIVAGLGTLVCFI